MVAPRLQTSILGGGNGVGAGSIFDLQDIQVLKGPQGTLFGRNTTGGAILLVPQQPTDTLEGYVEGTYGNYNERRLQGVINVPLSDTFKVRFGVDRNQRDGYMHNRSGIGPRDFNNVELHRHAAQHRCRSDSRTSRTTPSSRIRIRTRAAYVGKFVFCTNAANTPLAANPAFPAKPVCNQLNKEKAANFGFYDVENSVANPYVRDTTWQIINTTTWRASDALTVKNIASYGQAEESYSFNLDGDVPQGAPYTTAAFTPAGSTPFVVTYPGPHHKEGSEQTFTDELQFQGRSVRRSLGRPVDIRNSASRCAIRSSTLSCCQAAPTHTRSSALPRPAGTWASSATTIIDQDYALYAQGTFKFTSTLSLTAGIRETWDYTREESDNIRVAVSPTGPTAYSCPRVTTLTAAQRNSDLTFNQLCMRKFNSKSSRPTWLIDLDYKPSRDMLVYAKYSRGYRAGGVNEANVGLETWQPEKVDDYEVGFKSSFRGTVSGTFNVNGFWNDFSNQQSQVTINACTLATNPACHVGNVGIAGVQNIGQSRMRGVEVDTSLSMGSFRIDAGYAYLEAKVIAATVPFCDPTQYDCAHAGFLGPGNTLTFSPKNRVTVTGTYTLPVDPKLATVLISATFTHTDSQYSTHSDDILLAQIPYNAEIAPATNLVNLNLDLKNVGGAPVDLAFFATNLTNQKYWVAVTSSTGSLGGESVVLGEPRMFGGRLRVRFGS